MTADIEFTQIDDWLEDAEECADRAPTAEDHPGPLGSLFNELTMVQAAQLYADLEMSVFPLSPREKRPATPNGFKDASNEPAVIAQMWEQSDRNIGLATGAVSGVVVVDLDGDDGEKSWSLLQAAHEPVPPTCEARTGRGRHLVFAYAGDDVRSSTSKLGAHIDVRANGGYVVVPPSIHPSGTTYTWVPGKGPDQIPAAPLPDWLRDLMLAGKPQPAKAKRKKPSAPKVRVSDDRIALNAPVSAYARAAVDRECASVAHAEEGTRNDRLNAAAFSLGQLCESEQLDDDDLTAWLMSAAIEAGLPEEEAQRTVAGGLAAGRRQPREVPARLGVDDPWPDLIPLRDGDALPVFSVDALPQWLAAWVSAEAEATQVPADMPAMLALGALAACVGRRFRIKVRDGWNEPTCLFVAVVMPPGTRKSVGFRDATAPIVSYEREAAELLAPEIMRTRAARDVAELRLDEIKRRASKAEGAERSKLDREVAEAAEALLAVEVVTAPRVSCGDTTQEQLVALLASNGGSIAVVDAEGCGPVALMLGRYASAAPSIDVYLRGHAGDPIRFDRVRGNATINIPHPALTLAVTVQPEVLLQLGARSEMRGLGLLARIAWCVPMSTVGRRRSEPSPMPSEVRDEYMRRLRSLLEIPAPDGGRHTLHVSADAWVELRALMDRIEPQLAAGGVLGHVADWAGKLAGLVARIAAVLHAADHGARATDHSVSADTMAAAVRIGEYLLAHARRAMGMMNADPEIRDAQHIIDWLSANDVERISRRDLHRGMRSRFSRATDMERALAILQERGWIRQVGVPAGGAARRTTPYIQVRPDAKRTDGADGTDGDSQNH